MRLRPFHYAWVVLAVSFVAVVLPQGLRIAFGAFVPAWEHDFGTNRAYLAGLSGISFLIYGFGQPVAGRLADRFGGRSVLAAGVVIVGVGAFLVSLASSPVWLGAAYVGVASLGFAASSNVAPVSLIVRWFETHRGLALGLWSHRSPCSPSRRSGGGPPWPSLPWRSSSCWRRWHSCCCARLRRGSACSRWGREARCREPGLAW
jgi:sugar phosphate permease